MANVCSLILLILVTILFPPIGVALVAGCGADVLINIGLTLLGYLPGHLHAFYVLYVYHARRDQRAGSYARAPGIYSERVQTGGGGTCAAPLDAAAAATATAPPPPQGQYADGGPHQYGTLG